MKANLQIYAQKIRNKKVSANLQEMKSFTQKECFMKDYVDKIHKIKLIWIRLQNNNKNTFETHKKHLQH